VEGDHFRHHHRKYTPPIFLALLLTLARGSREHEKMDVSFRPYHSYAVIMIMIMIIIIIINIHIHIIITPYHHQVLPSTILSVW